MISQFYTRKECATRYAVFYSGNMMASSFSGLISAGIFEGLDDVRGLAGVSFSKISTRVCQKS